MVIPRSMIWWMCLYQIWILHFVKWHLENAKSVVVCGHHVHGVQSNLLLFVQSWLGSNQFYQYHQWLLHWQWGNQCQWNNPKGYGQINQMIPLKTLWPRSWGIEWQGQLKKYNTLINIKNSYASVIFSRWFVQSPHFHNALSQHLLDYAALIKLQKILVC